VQLFVGWRLSRAGWPGARNRTRNIGAGHR